MDQQSILIHIGYHKTGTTWLQSGLFGDERSGFTLPWDSGLIRELLVAPTQFEFDALSVRRRLEENLGTRSSNAGTVVMSDERLSGSPHAGGYDSALIADRLAEVFPEGKILIVIREQRSAIHSIYQQFVRDGGAASLKHYLFPRNPFEVPQFHFAHLEYHHLIRRYFSRFGPSRVLVMLYETLVADSPKFVKNITQFVDLKGDRYTDKGKRYRSLSPLTIELKRWANLIFVRNSLNPSGFFYVKNHERRFESLDRVVPSSLSRLIKKNQERYIFNVVGARYRESNAETAKLIGLDLSSYGYL